VPKLRCNKRSVYIERPIPPSPKRRPHFETRTCLGKNTNFGHGFRETEVGNDCAGEGQQRFDRSTLNFVLLTRPRTSVLEQMLSSYSNSKVHSMFHIQPYQHYHQNSALMHASLNVNIKIPIVSSKAHAQVLSSATPQATPQRFTFSPTHLHYRGKWQLPGNLQTVFI
jgi:hypothetical protein